MKGRRSCGGQKLTLTEPEARSVGGQVEAVTIRQDSNVVEGDLLDSSGRTVHFETPYPDGYEEVLTGQLIDAGVEVDVDAENPGLMQWFLVTILPYVLLL